MKRPPDSQYQGSSSTRLCAFSRTGLCKWALEGLLVRGGARGTRTLTALRPGDFKSPMSTISSSPLGWLPYYVGMILTRYKLSVNHLMSRGCAEDFCVKRRSHCHLSVKEG